jgi:hypothetical protein
MGMTVFIRRATDRVNDLLVQAATPRVVERERERLDRVEHELGVLLAQLESCVRERDRELGLLDSAELRLALGDLHERTELFFRCLERGALGVEGLLAFIESVAKVGAGDIKAAVSVEEVADALGRTLDHVQDYMIGHDLLDPDAISTTRIGTQAVRKHRSRATQEDAATWRNVTRVARLAVDIEMTSGRATLA